MAAAGGDAASAADANDTRRGSVRHRRERAQIDHIDRVRSPAEGRDPGPLCGFGATGSGGIRYGRYSPRIAPLEFVPMPDAPLISTFERALKAMWPRRAQQELLLDLGERKAWDAQDREAALAAACAWMGAELGLVVEGPPPGLPSPPADLASVRDLGTRVGGRGTSTGVAKWAEVIASAVGSSPKTLANSLRDGLRPARPDHRWLASLMQAATPPQDDDRVDAWLYHRRSPANVARALGSLGIHGQYTAGDATLVFSLLALWQRRRPTHSARSNKGQPRSRRETPKPVAALTSSVASPGQVPHMLRLARLLPGGRDLALLCLEAALTEAHLAPHAPRRAPGPERHGWDGETWLRAVEHALTEFSDVVGTDEAAAIAFRIERMRAWRESRPLRPIPTPAGVPYVEASLALEATRGGEPPSRAFSTQAQGLLMLLPLLRSRGFELLP